MKPKILFLNGGSKKFGEDFRKICQEQGTDCVSMRSVHVAFRVTNASIDIFANNSPIDLPSFSFVFARVRRPATHTSALLLQLAQSYGIPFNDPISVQHTLHGEKISQMLFLACAGIPVPPCWIFSHRSFASNRETILPSISYPCVLKTNGSQGQAVWKISSEEHLIKAMQNVTHELMILQEYVPNTFDIRALFLFGECLGAIARSSTDGFYNNISHGGKAEVIKLTQEEEILSQRACKVTGIDFAGVDLVRTKNGPLLFEVNSSPQVYGFENATGMSVGAIVAKHILQKRI